MREWEGVCFGEGGRAGVGCVGQGSEREGKSREDEGAEILCGC
jgi:hypothetical protein